MVLSDAQAACTLHEAGWPSSLIPTMVAVGHLESGLNTDAVNPSVGTAPPTGWLQVRAFPDRTARWNLQDPLQQAQAGLAVYQSQGLGAWTTAEQVPTVLPKVEASLHGWDASQCSGGAGSSSSSSSGDLLGLGTALGKLSGSVLGGGQVLIGLALVAAAVLLLVSQTGAGRAAGRGAAGAARRGLRAVPGLGMLA